jgi:hypothetical protein
MSLSSSSGDYRRTINTEDLKKKIEAGEHYFTKEELDAIWWDGYEHGSLDSAYDMYDKRYAAAIDGYL